MPQKRMIWEPPSVLAGRERPPSESTPSLVSEERWSMWLRVARGSNSILTSFGLVSHVQGVLILLLFFSMMSLKFSYFQKVFWNIELF